MRLWNKKYRAREIAPDEIFLDSSNLPSHDAMQFEGRVERPVSRPALASVGVMFVFLAIAFGVRAFSLQVSDGAEYATISKNNTLEESIMFATRGVIFDRTGREIAWNAPQPRSEDVATSSAEKRMIEERTFALRKYTTLPGLAHVLGFVQYPKADARGDWWREVYKPVAGVELSYDSLLAGANGARMVERNARGEVERENIVAPAENGSDLTLSIDADVQSTLYRLLWAHAQRQGFKGGAAVIMDVKTGELIALTSFPEYDNRGFAEGDAGAVRAAYADPATPLLDRAVSGLYAPGSIVKPIFAAAALAEGIISPDTKILSKGAITIPNPYDPEHPSIFRDWTVHGWVDMREALAVSSDEYFYTIGGGYGGQAGLGIARIDEYARLFGLGEITGIALEGESAGVIPTPEWKEKIFGAGDPWRIGNTYHTAIGQYGFQLTPLQAARFTAAIANGGTLLTPQLTASSTPEYTELGIADAYLQVVREGMRMAVTSTREDATVKSLNISGVDISAKTGTAQIGTHNQYMNSWSIGFWPSDHPRYAYAVVLEKAPAGTLSGAAPAMRPFFEWLASAHSGYIR